MLRPFLASSLFAGMVCLPEPASVFRMSPGEHSLNLFARSTDVLAVCSIRLKFQIGIQTSQLRSILVSLPVGVRQHQVGLREVGVAEKRFTRAFFCFVQPI